MWNLHQVRERDVLLQYLQQQKCFTNELSLTGVKQHPWRNLPYMWKLLGAEPVTSIWLQRTNFSEEDRQYIQSRFPEASVFYIQ